MRGLSLPVVLFLIFLVLKLCNVIAWSWWWVTCPLWFGFAAVFVLAVFGIILGGGLAFLTKFLEK